MPNFSIRFVRVSMGGRNVRNVRNVSSLIPFQHAHGSTSRPSYLPLTSLQPVFAHSIDDSLTPSLQIQKTDSLAPQNSCAV